MKKSNLGITSRISCQGNPSINSKATTAGLHSQYKSSVSSKATTAGLTLVALVVTIVVLLILAGITIVYVFGDNGVFGQASKAKIYTELAKIEEKAGIIYSDKLLEKITANSNAKPTMQEIVDELQNQGDKIEQVAIDGDGVTGILLDRESMTLGFSMTNTIKVTLQRSDTSSRYYAVVEGKYYEMHFNGGAVTIDRTPSEVANEGTKQTLNMNNSNDAVAIATLDESTNIINVVASESTAGTTTVIVTYGSYTKTCEITVRDIPMTTAMELNSIRARIAAGHTRWLSAMTTPVDALQEFDWSSSDTSIATVDNKGVITAKKAGTTTITAKTIDGSNKQGTCEVTVVENTVDVATLTEIQTGDKNIIAKDSNGNLITVPIGFKVLTSEGIKVTDGIVIQDEEENEFVWVPVDSVSTGTSKVADDIRLGRYDDFTTKNSAGNYIPKQDADHYEQSIRIRSSDTYYKHYHTELNTNSVNMAKNLGDFVTKTKGNGGYYIARYEASKGTDSKAKSQYNKVVWNSITQPNAAIEARNMYSGNNYVESDLINSYAWDTAIILIQKYSNNNAYCYQRPVVFSLMNSGMAGDKVCNIHDMASNCLEWSTEYSNATLNGFALPCGYRGGCYYRNGNKDELRYPAWRNSWMSNNSDHRWSFRVILYML